MCTIPPGQEYRKKLAELQTTAMIRVAATPADVRKQKILTAVKGMDFNNDVYAQKFGITVDDKMVKFEGRYNLMVCRMK